MTSKSGGLDAARAAAATYHRSHVMSSTPAQLVVILYERLLADLQGVALSIRSGDIEAKSERLQRATEVIFELLASLDRTAGGEVSERLVSLYMYMISRLGEVSRTLDPEILDELASHTEALLSAWRTLSQPPTDEQQPSVVAGAP